MGSALKRMGMLKSRIKEWSNRFNAELDWFAGKVFQFLCGRQFGWAGRNCKFAFPE